MQSIYRFLFVFFLLIMASALVGQEMIYTTASDLSREEQERRLPQGVERSPHHGPQISGDFSHSRVQPPFWWAGKKDPNLELIIYDDGIAHYDARIETDGVQIIETVRLENPNYLVLRLEISQNTPSGTFLIMLSSRLNNGTERVIEYELKERCHHHNELSGLNTSDVIYLIMPDRFANGDYANDSFNDMNQQGIDRRRVFFRHGGDIQGVIDHLDYLEELGVTALWLNPVMENDQPYESYHGYAITDHYVVDRRLGSNELYRELSEKAAERGIKIVHDVIYNHFGDHHWMFKDLPAEDFFHWHDEFTRTTYRSTTLMDPYAARTDLDRYQRGWFDNHMPDVNQKNQIMANFLIQNTIWFIEYFKLNGLRIDTYSYSDLDFMADLAKRVYNEYPEIGIFSETWVHGPGIQSYFATTTNPFARFNSYIDGLTDFQLYYAILEALNEPQGWTKGVERIYYTLAQDHLYKNPYAHVTFVDNHDLDRFLSAVDEDMDKFKTGLILLFTTRGIPMIYYGTEIAMKNRANPDGWVREGFPGGWKEDEVSKFTADGRTDLENEIFDFVQKLISIRKDIPAFGDGCMIQFIPETGIYAFYRLSEEDTYLVLLNFSDADQSMSLNRYLNELGSKPDRLTDILNGGSFSTSDKMEVKAFSGRILKVE